MRNRLAGRALVALFVAAVVVGPSALPSAAAADSPALFTVLQSAYYSFGQPNETSQSATDRVVLLEQAAPATGPAADLLHNASDTLLNSTSRSQLVLVEYQLPYGSNPLAPTVGASRFADYYKADDLPTAVFDGTGRTVAFAANTPQAFEGAFNAASAVPALATIWARGGIVLQNGYLDADANATTDVSGARVYLRAILVAERVASPSDGRPLRYVALADLGALRFDGGHAAGRFNFSVDPAWPDAPLAAVLYVQSDGPVAGTPPPDHEPARDLQSEFLESGGPFLMLGTLAALVAAVAYHERGRTR